MEIPRLCENGNDPIIHDCGNTIDQKQTTSSLFAHHSIRFHHYLRIIAFDFIIMEPQNSPTRIHKSGTDDGNETDSRENNAFSSPITLEPSRKRKHDDDDTDENEPKSVTPEQVKWLEEEYHKLEKDISNRKSTNSLHGSTLLFNQWSHQQVPQLGSIDSGFVRTCSVKFVQEGNEANGGGNICGLVYSFAFKSPNRYQQAREKQIPLKPCLQFVVPPWKKRKKTQEEDDDGDKTKARPSLPVAKAQQTIRSDEEPIAHDKSQYAQCNNGTFSPDTNSLKAAAVSLSAVADGQNEGRYGPLATSPCVGDSNGNEEGQPLTASRIAAVSLSAPVVLHCNVMLRCNADVNHNGKAKTTPTIPSSESQQSRPSLRKLKLVSYPPFDASRNSSYRHGAIKKIIIKNFTTHSELEANLAPK